MTGTEPHGIDFLRIVALLGAGVVAVPIFTRLKLGPVLGYLAAGLAIGPFGLKLFADPQSILHVAELGVVLFLFIIGLEMRPSHLWSLRRDIFGLGLLQVVVCSGVLTLGAHAAGLPLPAAFVVATGFVMTSTAVVMQMLEQRGELTTPCGQRIVAILLLEDLAIVPLLAIVALLAPERPEALHSGTVGIAIALAVLAAFAVAGKWLLNPFFRLLAASRAREVMTAAALLVVLGAALLMQFGGLSMAMGAFVAGVMLSESTFRHQLEADIEPFRGILLGLFFMSVGMSLDLSVFKVDWQAILLATGGLMALKGLAVYAVARLMKAKHSESLVRAVLMAQGGEFAFVLYAAAANAGIFTANINALATAAVILSMAFTPLVALGLRWMLPKSQVSMDGVEEAHSLSGDVLIIGFGRFGQVASQVLLARGLTVSIIDIDLDMIRSAEHFGFKVYYGDGLRLDVLRTSGAGTVQAIAVCVDNQESADRIVELAKREFPHAKLLVRSYDRVHSLKLIAAGVDFQIRETFESALAFGEAALRAVNVPDEQAAEIAADIRRLDGERVELELTGGIEAGRDLMHGNVPKPLPLTKPRQAGQRSLETTT